MNPFLDWGTEQDALAIRRETESSFQGFAPTGRPTPGMKGLQVWLDARRGVPIGWNDAIRNPNNSGIAANGVRSLVDQGKQLGGWGTSELKHYYDNATGTRGPRIVNMIEGGVGFAPNYPIIYNYRYFSYFIIVDLMAVRPGIADLPFTFGSSNTGKCILDSTTRRMGYTLTSSGSISTTMLPWSRRCLLGWVGDGKEFRYYMNDQVEKIATPLTQANDRIGSVARAGGTGQYYGWTDQLFYQRPLSDDEVFRRVLPYARTKGVDVEYNSSVVCEGDSIVQGLRTIMGRAWPDRLKLGHKIRHVNIGLQALTTGDIQSQGAAKRDIFLANGTGKKIYCIAIGSNDMVAGTTAATVYSTFSTLVSDARSAGADVVIASTVLARTDVSGVNETNRVAYNALVTGNAAGCDEVLDIASDSLFTSPGSSAGVFSDGVHPNDYGQEYQAETYWRPTILKYT